MDFTRRDFIKASSAIAAAFGLHATGLSPMGKALALEDEDGGVPVVWLQGQSCSGCSVSLLNSIYYTTIDDLLLNTLDLDFHSTIMPAAGYLSVRAAEQSYRKGGYVLVIEGAIPTGAQGSYCYLWPGLTMEKGVARYAKRAAFIMAVGSCASFGGLIKGAPNPTGAKGLDPEYYGKQVIKVPGCPSHPDWVVGTIAHLIANGEAPPLDAHGRPTEFFGEKIHRESCPQWEAFQNDEFASRPSESGCMFELGCKGRETFGDCPFRGWNGGGKEEKGVSWCVSSGAPCIGCTEPDYPDGKAPFYTLGDA